MFILANSHQVALYNAPMAAGPQIYPQSGAPIMSSMQPQMPTYQHPTHLQSTIMPTSSLMPTPVAFGASTPAVTASTLDQSASNNLQLVMLESRQIQSDVRNQVMQVSTKLDQVHQKMETLASRDSMMGTSGSQVTLEAAVLVQNIQRIVQVSLRLLVSTYCPRCSLRSFECGLRRCLQKMIVYGSDFNKCDFNAEVNFKHE